MARTLQFGNFRWLGYGRIIWSNGVIALDQTAFEEALGQQLKDEVEVIRWRGLPTLTHRSNGLRRFLSIIRRGLFASHRLG